MTTLGVVLIVQTCTALVAWPATAQSVPVPREGGSVHHDLSPPLRDIVPREPPDTETYTVPLRRAHAAAVSVRRRELTGQAAATTPVSTVAGASFDGLGLGFVGPQGTFVVNRMPPDPNGAVGTTQFVEWVNTSLAIFDKSTGVPVYGPVLGNTLWAGFGGLCESNNDGDPIVQYDKAANRWVLTQFAVTGGPPYFQCLAVSATPDATGAFHRYAFEFSDFNDYAKIGIWSDAYYMTFNMFQGSLFLGAEICALERAAMLNGDAASSICQRLPTPYDSLLPADVDGATPPPAGAPAYFMNFGTDSLNLWSFHVDFLKPSQSALNGPTTISVTPFTEACGGSSCIPQADTEQKLDSLGDRLMQRLAYRNFGDHEALVATHSVDSPSGVRWYELRHPGGNPPVLYQQGTFAPDASDRWMGSIAMDRAGDIGVGYSVSNADIHPGIRYTGRVPSDPLGTLEGERSIEEGAGSQTQKSRWGDYTSMTIDPVDDCTFWYVNQYLPSTGSYNWITRIASFRFPSCSDPTPTATATIATSTPSATPTVTATPSITRSATRTSTPSVTPTITRTPTFTRTATLTRTNTPSATETPTRTATLTRTATATPTATSTSSATRTATRTRTPTWTAVGMPTSSPSMSATATATESASATPSPTATPTETSTATPPGSPSATATPVATDTPAASPTAAPLPSRSPILSPTATETPRPAAFCTGDCDRNGQVSVDELLTMVEVTLGDRPVSICELGDTSGDGQITVDEILTAVTNALNGCPTVLRG